MEIIKENKTKEIITYIASDGIKFENSKMCKEYENKLASLKNIAEADKLRIKDLDDYVPVNFEAVDEQHIFVWYKVNNKSEFDKLNAAYWGEIDPPKAYPETYCIEAFSEEHERDFHFSVLTDMMDMTKVFWSTMGYTLEMYKNKEEGVKDPKKDILTEK